MEKDLLDIVRDKEYFELSSSELAQLSDLCTSEEEFLQLKNVFIQVDAVSKESVEPKPATKASLDDLFASTYPKASPIWYSGILAKVAPKDKPVYRQPLMQLAAVALLLLLVVPMFNSGIVEPNKRLAQAEISKEVESIKENVIQDVKEKEVLEEEVAELNTNTELMDLVQEQERILVAEVSEGADMALEPSAALVSSAPPVSTHPDGIFIGAAESDVATSMSAVESTDLLELLTTTF